MHSLGLFPFLRSAISFSRMQLFYVHMHSREQQELFQAHLGAIFTANNSRAASEHQSPAALAQAGTDSCRTAGPGLPRTSQAGRVSPPGGVSRTRPAGTPALLSPRRAQAVT